MRCRPRSLATAVLLVPVLVLGATLPRLAAEQPPVKEALDRGVEYSPISGDPEKPRRHFRISNPARLGHEEARDIYAEIGSEMAAGYGASANAVALSYQSWSLFNRAPYRSATHGQRFVNNYANDIAGDYGRYEVAGILPVGSIVAKDSFTVTSRGDVEPGPLFVMEKMPKGFNYVSGDWRYTMIMSDGTLFGETKGVRAERVEYCITCHLAREAFDHLFFVPESARVGG